MDRPPPHLRSYRSGAEQRLYPHCSSWMYPNHLHQPCCPFRNQSKLMFVWIILFFFLSFYLDLVISLTQISKKPNVIQIQSFCRQQLPTNGRGFAPRLLCMGLQGCTFAIPLCCWKNTPWKQEFGMVFQCIVTIFLSDSCLAGCPKLTFEYSVKSCIFCGCNKIEK